MTTTPLRNSLSGPMSAGIGSPATAVADGSVPGVEPGRPTSWAVTWGAGRAQ